MAVDLKDLVDPSRTALLTMELQRGISGDLAALGDLREQLLSTGALDNAARLCEAARAAGVRVVHNTVAQRADGAGHKVNCRMFAAMAKRGGGLIRGTPEAEVIPELDVSDADIEVSRIHGMTPFTSTSLDQILRNLGVTTIVGIGNSVNLGIIGMVLTAVDLGYQVVVPRDAVAGVPKEYADAVIDNSISLLATVVTTDEVLAGWS